jgi:hypothetical protein
LFDVSVSFAGIHNDDTPKCEASQVTVAPHIVQMLSGINSDENSKSNTQVIHIQTSDALQRNEVEEGEFETVILSDGGEESDFVTGQVYELVSGQNLQLCLNGEFIGSGDGNAIQVLHQESLSKRGEVYNVVQDSEQQMIELESTAHLMSNKEGSTEEADTVVVIIDTNSSQENTL